MDSDVLQKEYPLKSPLPRVIGAILLFSLSAAYGVVFGAQQFGAWIGYLLAGASAIFVAVGLLALVNIYLHEGWAAVIGPSAVELPAAPYRGRRRDRVPYSTIEFVGVSSDPSMLVIHVRRADGIEVRWVRQEDLRDGTVDEMADLLLRRISDARR